MKNVVFWMSRCVGLLGTDVSEELVAVLSYLLLTSFVDSNSSHPQDNGKAILRNPRL